MNTETKQRRIGIVSVLVVLVVVWAWWVVVVPRARQYRVRHRAAQAKQTLQALKLPTGAALMGISTFDIPDAPFATGVYSTDLDFEKVKEHYVSEFAHHGFEYKGEERPPDRNVYLKFCAPDYDADLSPILFDSPLKLNMYSIVVHWKDTPC